MDAVAGLFKDIRGPAAPGGANRVFGEDIFGGDIKEDEETGEEEEPREVGMGLVSLE